MNNRYQIDPVDISKKQVTYSVSNNKSSKDCAYSVWYDLPPALWV